MSIILVWSRQLMDSLKFQILSWACWKSHWFTEDLREIIWAKRCIDHHWRMTRSELDQTWARHDIMDYPTMVNAAKYQYFFNLIASADSHPVVPWLTKALLEEIIWRSICRVIVKNMLGIWWVCSRWTLAWSWSYGGCEGSRFDLIIWREFDTVGSEVVEKVLMICSSVTSMLTLLVG